jgi:hypothetical protein
MFALNANLVVAQSEACICSGAGMGINLIGWKEFQEGEIKYRTGDSI